MMRSHDFIEAANLFDRPFFVLSRIIADIMVFLKKSTYTHAHAELKISYLGTSDPCVIYIK